MRCLLRLHRWNTWNDVARGDAVALRMNPIAAAFVPTQQRRCERCGKLQLRKVPWL